jgi:cell division protein FtsW (lipid II flippase)
LETTYPDLTAGEREREGRLFGLAFLFLVLNALALGLAPYVLQRQDLSWWQIWDHLLVLPVWGLSVWVVRYFAQRTHPDRDPILLPVAYTLVGWGLLVIWRLSARFGMRQTIWFSVATLALIGIMHLPAGLRWLRRYRYLWLIGGLGLTAATLFFGTSPSGGQSRLWLGCCGVYIQPSEPLRFLLVAFLASYIADRLALDLSRRPRQWLASIVPLGLVWGAAGALFIAQRDLGAMILILGILAVMLYLALGRWEIMLAGILFSGLGALAGYFLFAVVRVRLEAWLNPWVDPIGGSYQIVQSLIAVATGGLLGVGPGMGTPQIVPAYHTDFIFVSIVEEWGLIGGIGLIALLATLAARGLRVAARNQDPFAVLMSAGLTIALSLQSILIIGGNIRMLPLAGVTLPFVSYGGSSLVISFIALGGILIFSSGARGDSPFRKLIDNVHMLLIVSWAVLALLLGWWALYRSPVLVSRTDNPRMAIMSADSPRGQIVDREGTILADTVGQQGDYSRLYPSQPAAPVVGYSQIEYGQAGIERSMDGVLRGTVGPFDLSFWWSHISTGRPPYGFDVRLTIDAELQSAAYAALQDQTGAIVILDAASGEILTLASSPTFDPNHIAEDWESLVERTDSPLINRATQAAYQPGTSLGPLLLAWGLDHDLIDPAQAMIDSQRQVRVGDQFLACLQATQAEVRLGVVEAVLQGCPQASVVLGERIGADSFADFLAGFMLDQPLDLRLPLVDTPDVPLPEDAQALALESAGQGNLTITPLHLARALAALVNGGRMPALRVVQSVTQPNGQWEAVDPLQSGTQVITNETAQRIRQLFAFDNPDEIAALYSQSISGAEGQRVTWAAFLDYRLNKVIVIVLEGDQLQPAIRIGQGLLEDEIFSLP